MDQATKLKRKGARRWFIEQCGVGMGAFALNHLLASAGYAATQGADNPLAPKKPHFAPKARNVIFLFMAGAPSHLEMFDYKPQLAKFDGTLPPPELLKGYRAAFINPNSQLLGPKFKFAKYGQCGAELSELIPHTAGIVDDIASSRNCCPTSPRSSTTSRSSSRWLPTRSIMRRGS